MSSVHATEQRLYFTLMQLAVIVLTAAWHERVGGFVNAFFLPTFLTLTGLRTDIGPLGVMGPRCSRCRC